MADEQEQSEARDKHSENMRRLENLRDDVRNEITNIINRYYDRVPSDLAYERDERGYIRNDLNSVQRRIDETINAL